MSTIDLNQNIVADCLRQTSNIGSSTIVDICNGGSTTVPWGSMDWVAAGCLATVFLMIALAMFGVLGMVVVAVLDDWRRSRRW